MKETVVIISIVYYALLAMLCIAAVLDKEKKYYIRFKMLTSTAFLTMAFGFAFYASEYVGMQFLLLMGIVACWCGDLALGYYHKKRRKGFMLAGIASFAVAHILFLSFLYEREPSVTPVDVIVPILALPMVLLMIYGFNLHMGQARIPILIYSVLLTAVATKGVHTMLDTTTTHSFLIGFATQIFWFSDYALLFLYFYHAKKRTTKYILHIVNHILYFTSMYLMALSILFDK